MVTRFCKYFKIDKKHFMKLFDNETKKYQLEISVIDHLGNLIENKSNLKCYMNLVLEF